VVTALRGEIILPFPHAGQRTVRREARRHNWLAVEGALAGQRIIWGAPVYDQVRVGWDETRKAAVGVAEFNQSRMTAEFGRGAIIFRSFDNPDSARGHTADGVVLDECGDLSPIAWAEVVRPMLLDTNGWSWGIGTPKGRNWFWQEWRGATDREDSAAWQAPTLGVRVRDVGLERAPHPLENPEVSFGEIRRLWETMPEMSFRQEILAEFVESGGGVFRKVTEAAIYPEQEKQPGHWYVMGVDWGRAHDYTVLSVVDVTAKRQVAVDRFNRIDWQLQSKRLIALHERYKTAGILAEANAMGSPLIEAIARLGLPIRPWTASNATKAAVIDGLALALERGQLRLLDDETQTGELLAYTQKRLPSGVMQYGAPEGLHDDTVIALALAWQAATDGMPTIAPRAYATSAGVVPAGKLTPEERTLLAARKKLDTLKASR
jgi:hypothetical protein